MKFINFDDIVNKNNENYIKKISIYSFTCFKKDLVYQMLKKDRVLKILK